MSEIPYSKESISFFEEDLGRIINPHEDTLIIEADVSEDCRVGKVMVDNGSIMDILYYNAFLKMGYKLKREASTSKGTYV